MCYVQFAVQDWYVRWKKYLHIYCNYRVLKISLFHSPVVSGYVECSILPAQTKDPF
jgi:hypothetical protein